MHRTVVDGAPTQAQAVRPGEAHLELTEDFEAGRRDDVGSVETSAVEARRTKGQYRHRRARCHEARERGIGAAARSARHTGARRHGGVVGLGRARRVPWRAMRGSGVGVTSVTVAATEPRALAPLIRFGGAVSSGPATANSPKPDSNAPGPGTGRCREN